MLLRLSQASARVPSAARTSACATFRVRSYMRSKHIAIIGAPLDLGSGRRGVDMGPSAVRVANLNGRLAELGYQVDDLGNVPVIQRESQAEVRFASEVSAADRRNLYAGGRDGG